MSMELDHSFTVPVPPDRAWEVLLDVERIAPCMPGATVEEFDGEVVTGRIRVKVGPVSLTYRGTAKFTERDPDTRVVVVDASGKETRGAGTASAAVRASLVPSGEGTEVSIHTTMNVTGRPAQFGRGVIAEVGGKLVEKFAENLAQMISDGGVGPDRADGAADAAVADAAVIDAGPAGAGPAGAGPADAGPADAGPADAGPADAGPASSASSGAASLSTATSSAENAGDGSAATGSAVATDAGPAPAGSESAAAPPPVRTATVPPAAQNQDSINLVRLVGPAVLKRVLPVAAGIAALALLGRRLWHRLHRGDSGKKT
jgi:carbon monoxide dehydrogenase subunit G